MFIAPRTLRIEVDERTHLRRTLPMAPLANWNPNYSLAPGKRLTIDRRWLGSIERACMLDTKKSSYTPPGRLIVPRSSGSWSRILRSCRSQISKRGILANILGFIPLGCLSGAASRGREACFPWQSLLSIANVDVGLMVFQLAFAERMTAINDLIFTVGDGIRLALCRRIPIIKRLRL